VVCKARIRCTSALSHRRRADATTRDLCLLLVKLIDLKEDRSRPSLCENALDEASGSAVSAAAAVTQQVEFLGEGPAPYAFIAAIRVPAPRILIVRFKL
jgi:hypothetical protein